MKTKQPYRFILVPTAEKQLGLPMKCIKKTGVGIMPGEFGFCYDPEWFNINGVKYWEPQHLHLITTDKIRPGDWCILLDSFDNVFLGAPQQYKPSEGHVLNDGLRRVVATTDKTLGLPLLPYYLVQEFSISQNRPAHLKMATVYLETEFDDSEWDEEVGTKHGVYYRPKVNEKGCVIVFDPDTDEDLDREAQEEQKAVLRREQENG
jgi:hypothetical protein